MRQTRLNLLYLWVMQSPNLRCHHLSRGQFNSSGGFTFDGSFTRNAVADYLIGRPSNLFMQSPLEDATRNGNYHLYAQDDFKVNRRLTLNLGLRYELNFS